MGFVRVLSISVFFVTIAFAGQSPRCTDRGKDLPINNDQVLQWKSGSKNGYKARGHILGRALRRYPGKRGHEHFAVQIGKAASDTIEIVYNTRFGKLPTLRSGAPVEACGDYITSNKQSGPFPASPDGAILHWVHINVGTPGHEHGYVSVDGVVTGVAGKAVRDQEPEEDFVPQYRQRAALR